MVGILRELADRTAELTHAVLGHHRSRTASEGWDGDGFVEQERARHALAEALRNPSAAAEIHGDLRRMATNNELGVDSE